MLSNFPKHAAHSDAMSSPDPAKLRARLVAAIMADEITVTFQPMVVLRSRALSGFEALARWHDAELGSIGPAVFIPLTEKLGLLGRLTSQMIRRACVEASRWKSLQPKYFTLSFNVSPSQLQSPDLPDLIASAVAPSGFPLSRIRIEITETALLEDVPTAQATVARLKAMGIGIVLDDFGTGFSSLTRCRPCRSTTSRSTQASCGRLSSGAKAARSSLPSSGSGRASACRSSRKAWRPRRRRRCWSISAAISARAGCSARACRPARFRPCWPAPPSKHR
ncbi:MAG: EAL domain-containing protein [Acetobacteraceae bacterium]